MAPSLSKNPIISVIVTTYNFPEVLAISLASLERQTDRDFEIIVADDGSDERTKTVIEAARNRSLISIRHVTQEDKGFRAARIRNLAINESRGRYVVFLDGDCFVLRDFIANYRKLMEPGNFISGKRSFLRTNITRKTLAAATPPPGGRLSWFLRSAMNQCTRITEFMPLPDGAWRHRMPKEWRGVQTCNMGVWRSDIDKINGFDNSYVGHGLEDSDFTVRLIRSGVHRKLGDHACLVLHLEHERRSRPDGSPNLALFENTLRSMTWRTQAGLEEVQAVSVEETV